MSQFRPSLAPIFAVVGLLAASGLFAVANCSREDLYGDATFTDNVEAAYAECDEGEITFLASKHGIQTAFDNCGSNKFAHLEWSPDGRHLYFQLTHGGHILDGETKALTTVPTSTPIEGATWTRADVLVVPVGPSEQDIEGPQRFAFFNQASNTLEVVSLGELTEPRDLSPVGEGDEVWFTAIDESGSRHPYHCDPSTGEITRAFDFLEKPVERLVIEQESGLMSWSDGHTSELMRIDDGSSIGVFPEVIRAIPHPDGRYVALETLGAPISPFDQRHWNELSPEARKRELARRDEWLIRLPDWAPREMRPPEIQILDLTTDERFRITAFYGERFEWYRPRPYFCSFILWGIEGKQLHRNIALVDIAERLRMAGKGEIPMGMARVGDDTPEAEIEDWDAEPGAAVDSIPTPPSDGQPPPVTLPQ